MSNLLEEAIVDAAALRETAFKSAEAALIEKYSKEFKESVQKLLEQEETTTADTGEEQAIEAPAVEQTPETPAAGGTALENVPSSFLDGDDDEVITINFDDLKKEIASAISAPAPMQAAPEAQPATTPTTPVTAPAAAMQMEESLELDEEVLDESYDTGLKQDVAKDALSTEDMEEGWHEEQQEEYEEGLNLEDLELEEGESMTSDPAVQNAQKELSNIEARSSRDTAVAKQKLATAQAAAIEKQKEQPAETPEQVEEATEELEEDFSITVEELEELAEVLKVDLDPTHQLRGYMGTNNTERELADNVDKAAARDDEATKEREEEEKAMSDLKEKLSESEEKNEKLSALIEELTENLVSLKENTEKLSISNAKLLYTNKVLGDSSLNERQKQQIVENIAKATSVLEAKTIYGTLQSTVQNVSEKKQKESLSEALIRGSSPFLVRPKSSPVEDSLSDRMKILAGIKNKT